MLSRSPFPSVIEPSATAALRRAGQSRHEALQGALDMFFDTSLRFEAPPQQRALPLCRHEQTDPLRRMRNAVETAVERCRQFRLPCGTPGPQRRVPQILAQHKQALSIGFDAAISFRE